MAPDRLRSRVRWTLVVLVAVMVILSLTSRPSPSSEAATARGLVHVATQFEHDYQHNVDGPVWDRFDDASRALITRARYVQWHRSCPTSPVDATILNASPLSKGWWAVTYEISGVMLRDYWHRVAGQWRFSLVRSNPTSAVLYASTFANFARVNGCAAASSG
ncbi:MAG: hypothetical protein HIU57_03700 [Acidobacteria bacterium]|nr:hypothetical protein [Acidobacteriota bacterium]